MSRVTLSGQLVCRNDEESALVQRLLPAHLALTRAEPGCLSFDVIQTADQFVWQVEEEFADENAFGSHQVRASASQWGQLTAEIERRYQTGRSS
jgi:quinol monooxygenase YgiN